MNFFATTLIGFEDRWPLGTIFWIFIVRQRSWLLNWMARSIMNRRVNTTMHIEVLISMD